MFGLLFIGNVWKNSPIWSHWLLPPWTRYKHERRYSHREWTKHLNKDSQMQIAKSEASSQDNSQILIESVNLKP